MTPDYRIMQIGKINFYVENYTFGLLGLFPKWRPLRHGVGLIIMTKYFPTKEEAQSYAEEHQEFKGGSRPKVIQND